MSQTIPTEQDVLEAIRAELTAIKVPGAEDATVASTWGDLDEVERVDVEVVKALEDRYEVRIADARLKGIESVGDAVALVRELVGEKAGATA